MTKRMEGDRPLIPMVLYKYVRLIDLLEKKKAESNLNSLGQMFDPMIERAKKYCDLAVKSNTVVLATFLHPAWRMMLFSDRFASQLPCIQLLISRKFDDRNTYLQSMQPASPPLEDSQSEPNKNTTPSDPKYDIDNQKFNYYTTNPNAIEENTEMERYNKGDFPLDKRGKVLDWWKVGENW
jgi:hypothetical protein